MLNPAFLTLGALLVAPSALGGLVSPRAPPGSKRTWTSSYSRLVTELLAETIVQLFEWNWNSIAAECKAFLGPNGYSWIQVSPPMEHISGDQWWTDYQGTPLVLLHVRL